jgi:multidrug transporter EmrE-like cation transporter
MPSLSWTTVVTFLISIAFQVGAILLLPSTRGFTNPLTSVLCVASFGVALWMLARIVNSGVDLGLLIPISAAAVPLATIIAGILIFREPASPMRVLLLLGACGLVGVAGRVG